MVMTNVYIYLKIMMLKFYSVKKMKIKYKIYNKKIRVIEYYLEKQMHP